MSYLYYITGTRRGLGKALQDWYGNCNSLESCDIFINCKHDKFEQVELLYKAAELNKRIINIGSHASDFTYKYRYAIEKKALRDANHQLFCEGINTTCVNFGYIDTESQRDKQVEKMSVDQAVYIIDWILNQPFKIKEITLTP
tara:strand:- start:1295 stop:1723 length:429 start_codon:yes stop_codon:yes gene_type:complete